MLVILETIYKLYKLLNDPDFFKICSYLLISLFVLSFFTKPTFGYELSIIPKIGINFFDMNDMYFFIGYIIIYIFLYLYIMNKKINDKLDTYRKMNEKYNNYSSYDFFSNNASDVLNIVAKETGYIIGPVIGIFLIIVIGYLVINNLSKVAKPIVIITSIINFMMSFVIALINTLLFINFFSLLY